MILATVAAALIASSAAAQDRPPAQRQQLLELAYALGESHALRQACRPDDQYWRERMRRLIEVERPDASFAQRLADRFNTGFTVRQTQFPECAPAVRAEAVAAARRGRAAVEALSRIR